MRVQQVPAESRTKFSKLRLVKEEVVGIRIKSTRPADRDIWVIHGSDSDEPPKAKRQRCVLFYLLVV